MTALLLTACVGMITGAFLIFRISPMDFTLGVFRRLTAGPKSIRDEINETTQRKKPGFFGNEFVKMIFVSFLNSNIYPLKNLLTSRVCIALETPYSKASSHFPIASHLQ